MENSSNTVKFLWKLENFCFCDFYCNRQLSSPDISVHTPVPCMWSLYMFPNGYGIDKQVGIYLKRSENDTGPEEICVRFKISLLDADGELYPEAPAIEKTFTKDCEWGHNEFIKRSELVSGSAFLYQDTLTVLCHITIIEPNLPERVPRRQLSFQPGVEEEIKGVCKALNLMYASNLYTDITLKSKTKTFSVHKCILKARLPGLFEKLENVPDTVLSDDNFTEKFLLYAYSGKLDIKDFNPFNIKETLAEYGLLHLEKDLMSQSHQFFALTYFSIKKCLYSWKVLISLLNTEEEICSSFISDGFQKTVFLVHLSKKESGIWNINIKALKSNNDDIFVRCSISVRDPVLLVKSESVTSEHLHKSDSWWEFPITVILEHDSLIFNDHPYFFNSGFIYFDFVFVYPSGKVQSDLQLVTSDHTSLTDCIIDNPEIVLLDLEELYRNQYESDTIITAGNRQFRVHKCILCARSPYFRAMFMHDMTEKENNRAELKNDNLDERTFEEVVDKLLLFIYCGKFEARSPTFASHLLAAIEMYMIGEDYDGM